MSSKNEKNNRWSNKISLQIQDERNIDDIIEELKKVRLKEPSNYEVQKIIDALIDCKMGRELYGDGRYNGAAEYFERSIKVLPDTYWIYNYLANIYYKVGKYYEMKKCGEKLVKLNPNVSNSHNVLGLAIEMNDKDYDKALKEMTEAIRLGPKESIAYYNRGTTYFKNGLFNRALEDFNMTLNLDPKDKYALLYRVRTLIELNIIEKAYEDLKKLMELEGKITIKTPDIVDAKDSALAEEDIRRDLTKFIYIDRVKTTFSDVIGLDNVKAEIKKKIIYPMLYPDLAHEYKIDEKNRGFVFYGPTGCGKTYLANSIAGETKLKFYYVKLSEIFDMWTGNTERNLHNLFKEAAKNGPSIIFIDELDALGANRIDAKISMDSRRALNTILIELDLLSNSEHSVTVIGATNLPWMIDPALKRTGRLGEQIYIPPPGFEERKKLFIYYLDGKPLENIDYDLLGKKTELFATSDIVAVCKYAVYSVFSDAVENGKRRKISTKDLEDGIKMVKPSLIDWYSSVLPLIPSIKNSYPELVREVEQYEKIMARYNKKTDGTANNYIQ